MIPKVRRPARRRMIPLRVLANERISPSFARITLGGPDLVQELHDPRSWPRILAVRSIQPRLTPLAARSGRPVR